MVNPATAIPRSQWKFPIGPDRDTNAFFLFHSVRSVTADENRAAEVVLLDALVQHAKNELKEAEAVATLRIIQTYGTTELWAGESVRSLVLLVKEYEDAKANATPVDSEFARYKARVIAMAHTKSPQDVLHEMRKWSARHIAVANVTLQHLKVVRDAFCLTMGFSQYLEEFNEEMERICKDAGIVNRAPARFRTEDKEFNASYRNIDHLMASDFLAQADMVLERLHNSVGAHFADIMVLVDAYTRTIGYQNLQGGLLPLIINHVDELKSLGAWIDNDRGVPGPLVEIPERLAKQLYAFNEALVTKKPAWALSVFRIISKSIAEQPADVQAAAFTKLKALSVDFPTFTRLNLAMARRRATGEFFKAIGTMSRTLGLDPHLSDAEAGVELDREIDTIIDSIIETFNRR